MPFPLSEDELKKTENEIGTMLPVSYRESMMEDNGGTVIAKGDTWDIFPVKNQASRKLISRTSNHIIVETKSAKEWQGFPENAIAIGGNGCGDFLVLTKDGNEFSSKVYVWCHENGSLVLVAKDFLELKKA